MAHEDWVDSTPKRYGSKPFPIVKEGGSIYGWAGDGWYCMDENGMLVGGRHPTIEAAIANRDRIVADRAAKANPQGSP